MLFDVPPASHPAVIPVLKLGCGGRDADRLDVVTVGDRGGQPQQSEVIRNHPCVLGAQKDPVHLVAIIVGLYVPERWCCSQLTKLD